MLTLLVVIVKGLVEVALLALLGRGILALLAGPNRQQNLFYKLFAVITQPAVKLARLVSPKVILDQHMPMVATLLMVFSWIGLTAAKIYLVKFTAG
jgi:hypothetical protein